MRYACLLLVLLAGCVGPMQPPPQGGRVRGAPGRVNSPVFGAPNDFTFMSTSDPGAAQECAARGGRLVVGDRARNMGGGVVRATLNCVGSDGRPIQR